MRILPLLSILALAACSSTKAKDDTRSFLPEDVQIGDDSWEVSDESGSIDDTIGITMAMLDKNITLWNNIELSNKDEFEASKQRRVASKIASDTSRHFSTVEQQLQSGSVFNRQVAAMALGFTGNSRALPILLLALEDSEPAVVANAALGLSRLGFSETDLTPLIAKLSMDQSLRVRVNSSLAIKNIIKAGNPAIGAEKELRRGLLDEEPGVRVHCAVALAYMKDGGSIPDLALLLQDPTPLVTKAAAASMVSIGLADPHAKGPAAKGLAVALKNAKGGELEDMLIQAMQRLSKRNYGDDKEEWLQWAMNNTPDN